MAEISRQELFGQLIEDLQTLGTEHSSMGKNILSDLWRIYQLGLFKTERYNGEIYESFSDFCEEAIRPFYEEGSYFDKFVNVVDRVFTYVHIRLHNDNPIRVPVTEEPVSVESLIEAKGWISKLILISNKIEACQTDTEIEQLFFSGFTGTVQDVIEMGNAIQETHIPIRIPFIERVAPDGKFTLIFENISPEQYHIIQKKLGKILDKRLD